MPELRADLDRLRELLLRIDLDDPGTAATLDSCARAVTALARHRLMAMVEPFLSGVRGLVVGRTLLYPRDGDVAAAVDVAARLVHGRSGG